MEINITLIVQMLVFVVFVWFTMRFVWPPLAKAMEARQDKIAEGLAAAERGRKELELAQYRIKDELKLAKIQAVEIIDNANKRAAQLIEEAKSEAKKQAEQLTKMANEQIVKEINHAKEQLRLQVADLAIISAEKILKREVDHSIHGKLIDNLIEEI